jgi:GNAT superfamily N-acetyltransferase
MSDLEISIDEGAHPELVEALGQGLREHALPTTKVAGFVPLAVVARNRDGALAGGIHALVNWNWLHVALVWVSREQRGRGLGSRLLGAIEAEAVRRGCTEAHLDTFSYQARPFYERYGYRVFATLEDYPPGERRFFMRKTLIEADGRS